MTYGKARNYTCSCSVCGETIIINSKKRHIWPMYCFKCWKMIQAIKNRHSGFEITLDFIIEKFDIPRELALIVLRESKWRRIFGENMDIL